ncbi:MAG: hypothetical protein ACI4VQ_07970, partial [Clostridia bacterium]
HNSVKIFEPNNKQVNFTINHFTDSYLQVYGQMNIITEDKITRKGFLMAGFYSSGIVQWDGGTGEDNANSFIYIDRVIGYK